MIEFHHVSVLPEESIEALAVRPDGIYAEQVMRGKLRHGFLPKGI